MVERGDREIQTEAEKETLTVEETAQVLGIGRSLAYRMVQGGELPTLRLGRRILIPREALTQLLSAQTGESKELAGV